jgi:glutamyl-tRNA reductase
MAIVVAGLNHRTAPVELREQLGFAGCGLTMALEDLRDHRDPLQEGVILSTCNRIEVYGVVNTTHDGWSAIEDLLFRIHGVALEVIRPHLYYLEGQDAINHLMRVTAGLDSMIVGEPQILGQVNYAYQMAQGTQTIGPVLSRLFMQAIHCGKRARTETPISQYTTSVSHAAAKLIENCCGKLDNLKILIVGAGEMAAQAADAVAKHGATRQVYCNRTFSTAQTLANQYGGRAVNWSNFSEALVECDVVISATGAPHTVLHETEMLEILARRQHRELFLVDIAVPRDIQQSVGDLPGVALHDIDDLQHTVDDNLALRQAAIGDVELLIEKEIIEFHAWLKGRDVVPVITDLRKMAQDIAQHELDHALRRLDLSDEYEKKVVEKLAHRIVNKLLYEPTSRLREQASNGDGLDYARVVRDLFRLDETVAANSGNVS